MEWKRIAEINLEESENYLNHFEARNEWQDLVDCVHSLINATTSILAHLEPKCNCKKGD